MDFVELGRTKEKIPILGMGTWKLKVNPDSEKAALKYGLENGVRFIDTAEMYSTEDLVGEVLKGEKNAFLATKVLPNHFHYGDVIKACENSLKKLGVRQIDLYQLHWPNPIVPISETMKAMEKLVDDGKIRYIGISNYSVKEAKEAQDAMKRYEIASNQIEYSILIREPERELLEYCKGEHMTVIAYSPLGQGRLYAKKYARLKGLLDEIGKRYSKTGTQVALNWIITKENIMAIPKASTVEHVRENLGACGWKLNKADLEKINHFL